MSHYNTIFNQVLQIPSRFKFEQLVKQYNGNRYVKHFSCWNLFTVLLYAQIDGKDSLRDIETGLMIQNGKWYHLGLKNVKRSTISDANNRVDYRIYEGMFYEILKNCKDITPKHKFRFNNPLYTIDSTIIDLCLRMYPWAKFRKRKGALKLHYKYDHSGGIPDFLVISDGKQHDVKVAKTSDIPIIADSITSIDRAYIDYRYLSTINRARAYFVTRAKSNIKYEVVGQQENSERQGILGDFRIRLTGYYQSKAYPEDLRLVIYKDKESGKVFEFLTNNFQLSPVTIARIYKARWAIEIFIKWIKQNLKIKSFLGTSKNAVMSQIWVAMCYYLMLAYIKYQSKYKYSLLELNRVIKGSLFFTRSIIDLFSLNRYTIRKIREPDGFQLELF